MHPDESRFGKQGSQTMWKVKLNERLNKEVFDRPMHLKTSQEISVSGLIANALDA